MPTNISFNGSSYSFPLNGEQNWATAVFNYLSAVAAGTLQKNGGSFTLTADANFGNTFGLIAAYFKSAAANIAQSGIARLANADVLAWRNAGNSGDNTLGKGSTDNIPAWNSVDLVNLSTAQTLTNKTLTSPTLNSPTISSSPSVAPAVLIFGASASLNATTTSYLFPGFSENTVGTNELKIYMPAAGKLSNLYVWERTGSTTQGIVYTVNKNSTPSTITCTVPAGAGSVNANDTTHTLSVAAGDLISISAAGVSGIAGASTEITATLLFTQA